MKHSVTEETIAALHVAYDLLSSGRAGLARRALAHVLRAMPTPDADTLWLVEKALHEALADEPAKITR